MKNIILILALSILTIGLYSQTFEIPTDYAFESEEDYTKYEQNIIDCVYWLVETPVSEQKQKRMEAKAFLLKWLSGSPTVVVEVNPKIVTFMGSKYDLLLIFMGGWASYTLESEDYDNIAGSLVGISTVIKYYEKNKHQIGQDEDVEKYIKMKEEGKLEQYIRENVY